ncbi:NUDIX domain-containing protein [Tessaracoccus sp. MC1627]|uniref:NUDIX hydrolase n=1 Tax=Tessaracoccus sp. MC1627 TaxID=2760312 RepID=UPI0015FEFBE4|nr:NUDIX domain-containing protein [Tessaracoccus sp. MC1627]MBB1513881.1 NUDIX domain-containing protein [Tessaracoccus sp. MC1627]MBB1513891.1 NUDIX domain-containing protein [Tessaracoccus sp. MC1627]
MEQADLRIRNLAVGLPVRDGHVLVQEFGGADGEPPFVRAIGGGIEFGERADEALLREFLEELGVAVTAAELLAVTENIFTFLGRAGHEIVHIFSVECPALEAWPLDTRVKVIDDVSIVAWHRLDTLGGEGLPFYPDGALDAARSVVGPDPRVESRRS